MIHEFASLGDTLRSAGVTGALVLGLIPDHIDQPLIDLGPVPPVMVGPDAFSIMMLIERMLTSSSDGKIKPMRYVGVQDPNHGMFMYALFGSPGCVWAIDVAEPFQSLSNVQKQYALFAGHEYV